MIATAPNFSAMPNFQGNLGFPQQYPAMNNSPYQNSFAPSAPGPVVGYGLRATKMVELREVTLYQLGLIHKMPQQQLQPTLPQQQWPPVLPQQQWPTPIPQPIYNAGTLPTSAYHQFLSDTAQNGFFIRTNNPFPGESQAFTAPFLQDELNFLQSRGASPVEIAAGQNMLANFGSFSNVSNHPSGGTVMHFQGIPNTITQAGVEQMAHFSGNGTAISPSDIARGRTFIPVD